MKNISRKKRFLHFHFLVKFVFLCTVTYNSEGGKTPSRTTRHGILQSMYIRYVTLLSVDGVALFSPSEARPRRKIERPAATGCVAGRSPPAAPASARPANPTQAGHLDKTQKTQPTQPKQERESTNYSDERRPGTARECNMGDSNSNVRRVSHDGFTRQSPSPSNGEA